MNYLLVESNTPSIAPNIALMKWARWCELNGHQCKYVKGNKKIQFEADIVMMSFVFTFYSKEYEETINFYSTRYPHCKFIIGGVFPTLYPEWFVKAFENKFMPKDQIEIFQGMSPEIEDLIPKYSIEPNNHVINLYASRGCVNKCGYCAVPRLEGKMKSFKSIINILNSGKSEINARNVVLYDNNFTAHEYFDNIVDELIQCGLPVDIHGLHVDSFTEHQAKRFAQLKWMGQKGRREGYIRFSFDKMEYRDHIERAAYYLKKYDVKATMFLYMLYNYTDKPEDFWLRLKETRDIVNKIGIKITLYPQRYEPFKPGKRRKYIGPKWNKTLLEGIDKTISHTRGFLPMYVNDSKLYKYIDYGDSPDEFLEIIKYSGLYKKKEIKIGG